ncbi:DUF91 domain-containing protein [Maribellus sp. CM-23]|uniref:endonuclease NucS domain-containing protein n=1 Tax=Maribellus sp. CM-23 TaxID=2781026 RepID=UPI001F3671B3|nr:endonuclease NucS domain-containing protein [Maribellus sp. CM-23]MCE4566038.1 DUF91 domain-containing protein [Maribellus sp. CM-23]
MYKVNITEKSLTKLTPTNFSAHNLLERYDIQEWIEKTPEILGEELLIIAKELPLPSGSRLDLLAIDKNARLVVIELKRDDSGRDVDWQAIKYTSYCSNYLVDEIINHFAIYLKSDEDDARARIDDFIDEELDVLNHSQRIILVSKEFHSDVISSVLWLRDYGIDIECLRLVPFVDENNDLFVHPDKIIPLPEAKDYIVKKERKQKEIKKAQGSFDRGKVIESVTISLKGGLLRIDRYDTTTIIVFNLDEEREETAKPILREINDELNLGVPLLNSMGNKKNTRTLGKDIIAEIKAQQKEYKSDSR